MCATLHLCTGCDLCYAIHQASEEITANVIGGCEQTTSGVVRLRNMVDKKQLKFPMVAVRPIRSFSIMIYLFWEGKALLCMYPTSLYREEG
jgi:adenosylhomocysteinase